MPNLQAEARQVANEVMRSINGSSSPSILDMSGSSTPLSPDRAANKGNANSSKQAIPLRPSSRNSAPEGSNSSGSRKGLGRSSDIVNNIVTDVGEQMRPGNEESSPK